MTKKNAPPASSFFKNLPLRTEISILYPPTQLFSLLFFSFWMADSRVKNYYNCWKRESGYRAILSSCIALNCCCCCCFFPFSFFFFFCWIDTNNKNLHCEYWWWTIEWGWTPPSEESPCWPPCPPPPPPDRSFESRKALANGLCLIFKAVTCQAIQNFVNNVKRGSSQIKVVMILPRDSGRPWLRWIESPGRCKSKCVAHRCPPARCELEPRTCAKNWA